MKKKIHRPRFHQCHRIQNIKRNSHLFSPTRKLKKKKTRFRAPHIIIIKCIAKNFVWLKLLTLKNNEYISEAGIKLN